VYPLADARSSTQGPPMSSIAAVPRFTPKQGQYLAFIYAYTRALGRPPAVKPTCSGTSRSARPPYTKWCSPLNETDCSDGSRASRGASKSFSLPHCSRSYADRPGRGDRGGTSHHNSSVKAQTAT
jgi:hypothetical protein